MPLYQAIVLGVVQGLTEFLPVSSSAHLFIVPWLFGWTDPGLAFDVALHFGTLIAVLWYFRDEWRKLIAAAISIVSNRRVQTPHERRVVLLIIATIPGALAGLALNKYAESTLRTPRIVGVTLVVAGVILWIVDRVAAQREELDQMSWTDAIIIGLAQAFAIIPGVSRSGSTITAGRAVGISRESTAIFSFLLSMPIIAAAVVLEGRKAIHATGGMSGALMAGIVASAVSGWFAISFLIKLVSRHSYGTFAVYRVIIGLGLLAVAFSRA